ncbi:3',5'-cyclic AMP phosphodiesterase CpdA [Saccharicrinis carchari]|uniref:3',5'-cyclic AMP phosphodiesterase CpdA n=1 Tax=Saccharicrinis carchari TaxID=1168039 RepID=A0A521C4D9_SACCC|nr:metallophosphoesterase [Saccharicrinis carchari]SMO54312.1 3',5'-cyclic AMP phosphodiesterase CpdA [Saccharicrinis carchari]
MNLKKQAPRFLVALLLLFSIAACQSSKQLTTIVLLPDTQTYAQKFPHILQSQVDWILENKADIDIVLQQGDLTQNNNREEWAVVKEAFDKLNGVVPYALAVGNHDMGSEPGKFADIRHTEMFNAFFPYHQMSKLPAFGGVFEDGKMDNAYYLIEKAGFKWLIINLEFGPRDMVLDWANRVVRNYPDRTVIVNTHSYMYSDSTRQNKGDHWRPQAYGIGKDTGASSVNDGEQIWRKLIKENGNIRFVFSGHVLNSGVGNLVSINDDGWPVYQHLANYQAGVKGSVKGGNGFLRILKINHRTNTMSVKTYSPYTKTYKTDEGQDFIIKAMSLKQ